MKPQFMGYPLYFSTAVFNDLQVSNASLSTDVVGAKFIREES